MITLKTLFFWAFLVAGGWPIQFICKKCNDDGADEVDGDDDGADDVDGDDDDGGGWLGGRG